MHEHIANALTQLRDIHEPIAPSFWPLPLGWWLLLVCIAIVIAALVWWFVRRYRIDRPYGEIRRAANNLQFRLSNTQLAPHDYVSAVNKVFKYLLVDIEQLPGAARADGKAWLEMLAMRFNEDAFVAGSGRSLGNVRYMPFAYFDDAFVKLVESTLCHVRAPTKTKS